MESTGVAKDPTTFKRRWAILLLYVLFSFFGSLYRLQYSVLRGNFAIFYSIDYYAVDWLTYIFTVIYVLFALPALWLQIQKGLRVSVTIGAFLICLGGWLKVVSVDYDLFWVTFLAQTVAAFGSLSALSNAAPIAAIWFCSKQRALATSIALLGIQFGNLVNILSPLFAYDSVYPYPMWHALRYLFGIPALLATLVLVAILIFFRSAPPSVQSKSHSEGSIGENAKAFAASVMQILRRPQFLILLVAYGINQGVFYALLSQMEKIIISAEYIGITPTYLQMAYLLSGILGLIISGFLLMIKSVRKNVKIVCLVYYILTTIFALIFFLFLNYLDIAFVYVAVVLLGLVHLGYMPVAYEHLIELTAPYSLEVSSCLLAICAQICALLFTLLHNVIIDAHGDHLAANLTMFGFMVIGCVLTAVNKAPSRLNE